MTGMQTSGSWHFLIVTPKMKMSLKASRRNGRDGFVLRVKPHFRLIGGATFQLPEEAEAFHYFELLWDYEMWRLVTEMNRYAEQERRKNPPLPKSPKMTPVDVDTMKAFIGLSCDGNN